MTIERAAEIVRSTPGGIAGVDGAFFAYHASPKEGGHYFYDQYWDADYRHRPCIWCGHTRWQVRYEMLVPTCSGPPDIDGSIRDEEAMFLRLLERAPQTLRRFGPENPADMSGADLATFQHTHGLSPDMIENETGVRFSDAVMADFEAEMDGHRDRSRTQALRP